MSPNAFHTRIRASIANASLQAALDANAERRVTGRITALATLPDWRERRQHAHEVRADVIEHLHEYLRQFTQKASENGMLVHRAGDAAEAVAVILDIVSKAAPQGGRALVAKGKSMVSEEIELNHALEHAGHRVVETDLGEYIVQLRGEKPAHIITPAVHLRRQEVGQLFAEKLGLPYTEDIPTLTNTARRVLREVFLTANVGVSGVNFGIVETGAIVIVTNEGNGRMVTTMPPVHVALMGMERLLPNLDDLALLLSLLPRSATAQKLSVYTQMIHGPRRAGEADGAGERHLVILDNGRSRLRNSPLRESLYCIRCGACLNACPVFREIGGHAYVGADGSLATYSGPIGSIVSPGLLGMEEFGQLAQASSLCGACKDACPVDIDLPRLLTRVRAGHTLDVPSQDGIALTPLSRIGLRAYGVIGSSPRIFKMAQWLGGIGTRIVSPLAQWFRLPAFTGWGYSKDFPRVAAKSFRRQFAALKARESELRERAIAQSEAPAPSPPQEPAVERFCRELEALGGQVHRVSQANANERMLAFLQEKGITEAASWDRVEGLDLAWLAQQGIRLMHEPVPALKAGISGAAAAIAETGTLLITSGKGQPLGASLLHELHVAVLPASQIVWTLEEALRDPGLPGSAAGVLITGPSRTADIEMTLTIGVHGPKELAVFVVEPPPTSPK